MPAHSIPELIAMLRSDAPDVRHRALRALDRLRPETLTPADVHAALRAAAEPFPADDIPAHLIAAVANRPEPGCLPLVRELFPRYNPEARAAALDLLAHIDSPDAAGTWMDLLRAHRRETGTLPPLRLREFHEHPRHPHILFPELLSWADISEAGYDIYHLALRYLQHYLITGQDLEPLCPQVRSHYRTCEQFLRPRQEPEGIAWMWEDDYYSPRAMASLLLDVMGYLPLRFFEEDLRAALTYTDPRLKFYALISLLRHDAPVSPAIIRDVAASAEMRNDLYQELEKMERLSLFPQEFRNQAALAEAEMVRWLMFPTEIGRPPDEIELMDVITIRDTDDDSFCDFYVFRFRCEEEAGWAEAGVWMAGIVGPCYHGEPLSAEGHPSTFSLFEPWDEHSPEEHLDRILESLSDAEPLSSLDDDDDDEDDIADEDDDTDDENPPAR